MPRRPGGSLAGGLLGLRSFRLLVGATLASALGTWLATVALVIDVYDRTGSATWVGLLLVAEFVPVLAVALLAGPLVDRIPRRTILVAADLARAAVFVVLPFATSALQIVLLALLVGVGTSVFRPALLAGVPSLVPADALGRANGLVQGAENLSLAVGPVLGGVLVAWAGPAPAYAVNAASFALSAVLILRIRERLEQRAPGPSEGHLAQLVEGLALLRRSRGLRAVVVAWSGTLFAAALVNVAEVVLAKEVFGTGDAGYGLMLTTMGAGLVLGSLAGSSLVDRYGVRVPYSAGIGVTAVGVAAVAAAPGLWISLPLLLVAGLGNGVALVANTVLVQRSAPDSLRGRAFALAIGLSSTAFAVGMICAGPLTDAFGARVVWAAAGAVLAACALAAAVLTREVDAAPVDELQPARGT